MLQKFSRNPISFQEVVINNLFHASLLSGNSEFVDVLLNHFSFDTEAFLANESILCKLYQHVSN